MLHPAPCLGWAGIGVDSQVRFLGAVRPNAGLPAIGPVQATGQWNMNKVSLANCASN